MQIDELFSETEYLGPSALDFCASQPLAIKYIWAITFEWQSYNLLKCASSLRVGGPSEYLRATRHLLWISSVQKQVFTLGL